MLAVRIGVATMSPSPSFLATSGCEKACTCSQDAYWVNLPQMVALPLWLGWLASAKLMTPADQVKPWRRCSSYDRVRERRGSSWLLAVRNSTTAAGGWALGAGSSGRFRLGGCGSIDQM
jgi:hypothetical protein